MKQSRSIVQKRQQKIISLLQEHDSMQVSELSKLTGVSDLTIRRDLNVLESKGLITRFHGGAKKGPKILLDVPPFEEKGHIHGNEKKLIAKVVSSIIKDGDTLFLNSGTTTLEIIKKIKDRDVIIITNNALAASAITNSSAKLISTGGQYSDLSKSFVGDFATRIINMTYANLCILGVNGISSDFGVTTSVYQETMINELMVKRCNGLKIIAADGSKIGKTHCFTSIPINKIDVLVTDSSADKNELAKISSIGIRVILADQES